MNLSPAQRLALSVGTTWGMWRYRYMRGDYLEMIDRIITMVGKLGGDPLDFEAIFCERFHRQPCPLHPHRHRP